MTDTMRMGSSRALKPAAIRKRGRRNGGLAAVGATCAIAGLAAVGLFQAGANDAALADEQQAPSLAEITSAQSQSFDANLLTAVESTTVVERDESVEFELEPEPEPEPVPEPEPEPEPEPATEPEPEKTTESTKPAPDNTTYSGSDPRGIAQQMLNAQGMGDQWSCYDAIISQESNWDPYATNPSSGAYGIPQSLPGSKMATHGSDWQTNPATQIAWSIDYMKDRYGSPCGAYDFKFTQGNGWY